MTFDRRVADHRGLRVPGRHLRTDKVVLVAESMGTLPAVSLVKRRPDRPVGSGAWNANMAWAFRATCLRPNLTAGCSSRAWRWAYRSGKADRLVVSRLLAELAEGYYCGALNPSELS